MPESSPTVRDVFELPQPGTPEEESPRWQSLREWMSKEVGSIKKAGLPDLTAKVAELLEIPLPDIFLTSWKKTNLLKERLEESRKSPETALHLELGEHTINSQHRPHIEVRVKKVPVKKLEFTLRLMFKLKGFILKVQNGAVTEVQTGSCEIRGTLEYQGLTIAEKKSTPIALPGRISLERMRGFWEQDKPAIAIASAPTDETGGPEPPVSAVASVAAAAGGLSAAGSRPATQTQPAPTPKPAAQESQAAAPKPAAQAQSAPAAKPAAQTESAPAPKPEAPAFQRPAPTAPTPPKTEPVVAASPEPTSSNGEPKDAATPTPSGPSKPAEEREEFVL